MAARLRSHLHSAGPGQPSASLNLKVATACLPDRGIPFSLGVDRCVLNTRTPSSPLARSRPARDSTPSYRASRPHAEACPLGVRLAGAAAIPTGTRPPRRVPRRRRMMTCSCSARMHCGVTASPEADRAVLLGWTCSLSAPRPVSLGAPRRTLVLSRVGRRRRRFRDRQRREVRRARADSADATSQCQSRRYTAG